MPPIASDSSISKRLEPASLARLWARWFFPFCLVLGTSPAASAQRSPLLVEHGTYAIHLLLHTVGTEEYTLTQSASGALILDSTATTNDRGTKRTSTSTLNMGDSFAPTRLEQHSKTSTSDNESTAELKLGSAVVREGTATRTLMKPPIAFMGFGTMPAALQMMMMRYWIAHHRPSHLPMLRVSERALPLEIKLVGHDAFESKGKIVRLTRYTVANLIFGREILWMNASGRLAAVMTFAGGLPQEEVLDEYTAIAGDLFHSAVQQQMLDLADLDREVPPEAQGSYAIVGAQLIDGTNAAPLQNSVVIVRDGRIAAVGGSTPPAGLRIIHAEGKSLLPGLWEMHTHYSGVEFGPAMLAAGITTARDCGGEREFLATVRQKLNEQHALGPRLLLAGLIDSGGDLAFGSVDVKTPEQAVAAVDAYADAKFEQVKVYTQIQPDILKAIATEAHNRGMTVTGHVPAAMNAFEGVEDGMDQINHLQFVTRAMNPDGSAAPVNLESDRSKRLIALFKQRETVIDPTVGWGEMAGHPKSVDLASFEPGIRVAPQTLSSKYESLGVAPSEEASFRQRMDTNRSVIQALHRAGVPIVAGSDTGLIGYGLDRELELYVQSGMTPLEAIQSATIVSARAMKMDRESGSIEVGKRADLVLVDGNPLERISDLRRVVSVVRDGRMYSSRKLAHSVGFNR